ncbi:conserved hypothetical protein [Gloeothece citriformis PCC 7424]|uniref:Chromophore lyase CpcS/CpeS n=1 Tax=Gloeothece citriformis (strain PCC 7424) TaxID=65393 RepID=B7KDI6_GLOC7|nr:phycobiliprotein lyase [Gloeothece citriformis]ACK69006.1 conserved hypothetical protein [Gloeothece citriformis PCC 7424]
MISKEIAQISTESLVEKYFRQSEGRWKSQRRYYTLTQEQEPQEVVSLLKIEYLPQGASQLIELARLHHLESKDALICGAYVTWESEYIKQTRKPSKGSTVFGALGDILYRDRGFATKDPIKAIYSFPNPNTLCLRTEYQGSVFEEELKLIGDNYRTRQTIISRAGEEIMIGQYLEKRLA